MPFEVGIHFRVANSLTWKYFGTILFTEQMLIYLRYIYFLCLFLSVCGGEIEMTTFLPALEKEMNKNGQRKYCNVFMLLMLLVCLQNDCLKSCLLP